jgi:Holliday junction resolvase RusA-like endonuclease
VISIKVSGVPIAQGSLASFVSHSTGKVITPQDPRVVDYRTLLVSAFHLTGEKPPPDWIDGDTGLSMTLLFTFPRPKSHWRPVTKKRSEPTLHEKAPQRHTQRPDLDKLVRAVLDALTGHVYGDDKQVTAISAVKIWGKQGSTLVVVSQPEDYPRKETP